MFFHIGRIVMTVLATTLVVASGADARAELTRKELSKLFDLGWQPGAEAPTLTEEYFDDLAKASKFDSRVTYAYSLVRIKQRKYADAIKLTGEVLAAEPKDIHAWQTKVWLEVLTKDYGHALLSLDKLTELLPANENPDSDKEELYRSVAAFCGRVFGYLDGPAAGGTNEALRAAHRKKILTRLTDARKAAFEEGREGVTQKYLELTDEKLATKEKAQDDAEEEKDQKLKDLDSERQDAAKRESDLNQRREKLRSEMKSELDDLEKKDRPLMAEFNRLDARATVVRNELALINNDLARVQAISNQEKDPVLRARYFAEIDRLSILAARYDADFNAMRRIAAGVAAKRADLQQRAAQVQAKYGAQINSADKEGADLRRKTQRVAGQEKRVRGKPVSGETPQVRAKTALAGAFVTYEPFPLEQERERLLESVR